MSGGPDNNPSPPSHRRRSWPRLAVRVVALGLVGWLAWRYLRDVAWGEVLSAARHAEPLRLVAVALLCAAMAPLKALRTQALLAPFASTRLWALCEWYFASWAADNLLMSQAGLGLRVALLRGAGVPLLTAAAEQGLEKAIEGGTLLLLVPLVPPSLLPPSWRALLARPEVVAALLLFVALLVVVLVLLVRWRPELRYLAEAGAALRSGRVAAGVAALSLSLWAVELVMVALTLSALSLPWSMGAAALVVVAANLSAVVPGLPGNVGTFEAAVTAALVASGLDAGAALAAAVLYHLLHTVPVTLLGLTTLRRLKV